MAVSYTHLDVYKRQRQLSPKFSVNVLAGGELGYIQKENGYRPAKGGYTGFTGGLQFKYRLWGDVSLFAEPRTSLASYSLKTNEKEEGRYVAKKFTDNLYSINIGIEIQLSLIHILCGRVQFQLET